MNIDEKIKLLDDVADVSIESLKGLLTSYLHIISVYQAEMQKLKLITKSQQFTGYTLIKTNREYQTYTEAVEKVAVNFGLDAETLVSNDKRKEKLLKWVKKINSLNAKFERQNEKLSKELEKFNSLVAEFKARSTNTSQQSD